MKEAIRKLALDSGYALAGFADVFISEEDAENILKFTQSLNGEMSWFNRYLDLRMHPEKIMEGAKSVLILAVPYLSKIDHEIQEKSRFRISRYALGRDYHKVLRKMGEGLLKKIREMDPEIQGRITVDSAPVPEKIFAVNSGIAWRGKHTNVIHPDLGSYLFLSCLFLNRKFLPDEPMKDRCGTCRKCIDACPTGALAEYRIDAGRCISYRTIESKEEIPGSIRQNLEGWIFGCDICQDVCPYNKRERIYNAVSPEDFRAKSEVIEFLDGINRGKYFQNEKDRSAFDADFDRVSPGTPLRRAGADKLYSNILAVRKGEMS